MFDKLFKGQAAAQRKASFLPTYDAQYAPLLTIRATGFRAMFELLEARCATLDRPALIVETGSMREVGAWSGDGQSTFLFKSFADVHPSEVHTVDLDPQAAQAVHQACGEAVHAHTGDSVEFLYNMAQAPQRRQIDLLYLDSYDFDPAEPFPSAMHHIKELIAVRPCLRKGSIIAIDDNYIHPDPADGRIIGKGYLCMQWFEHLGIPLVHKGHQMVWQI